MSCKIHALQSNEFRIDIFLKYHVLYQLVERRNCLKLMESGIEASKKV